MVAIPAHTQIADEVAERSITLAQDRMNIVPLTRDSTKRIVVITYAEPSDLVAGRTFNGIVRERLPRAQTVQGRRADDRCGVRRSRGPNRLS